ncbi:Sphingosine-1-phosphate lyase [Trichinella spiralis]|uniref:Sphingosine-1-phosphate lyase n=1 Tax=Trichinella spiralis TaxID=6334 RepID=A0ABR3KRD4_TRISP
MSAEEKLIDCSAANSTSGAAADFPTGYFQRIPASTKISKKKTIQEKNAEIFLQTACQQTSQHGMEKRQ